MSEGAEFDITKPYCNLPVAEAMEFYDWLEKLTPPQPKSGRLVSRRLVLPAAAAALTALAAGLAPKLAESPPDIVSPVSAENVLPAGTLGVLNGEEVEVLLPVKDDRFLVKTAAGIFAVPMEQVEIEGKFQWAEKVRPLEWLGFDNSNPRLMDRIPQMGAGMVRIPLDRADGAFYEHRPQIFEAIGKAKENNLEMVLMFNPVAPLSEEETRKRVDKIFSLVGNYDKVMFELGNEPDVPHFWQGDIKSFAAFVDSTSRIIRGKNPRAKLAIGAMLKAESIPLLVEALVEKGTNMDQVVFSIHAHNSVVKVRQMIEALKKELGEKVKFIVTEAGSNASEAQKGYEVRRMIQIAREGGARAVIVFQLENVPFADGAKTGDWGLWGLFDANGRPNKAAWPLVAFTWNEANASSFVGKSPKPASVEVKVIKKNLFQEIEAPKIYSQVLKMREQRATEDPDFLARINPELNRDRINLVFLGGRKEDQLTDSMQIVSYHMPSNSVHVISIPRDLQSPEVLKKTRDLRDSRINQAWGEGGADLVKLALENATGLSMDLLLYANFDVIIDSIDETVGWIEMNIDRTINDPLYPALEGYGYDPFFLPAGRHRLDGATALKVARERHSGNDYIRSGRQQQILQAYFKRVLEESVNPARAMQMLKTVQELVRQKIEQGTLQADFDIIRLLFPDLIGTLQKTPMLLWEQAFGGGWSLFEMPTFFNTGITNRNFVVGAGVTGLSITKVSGGNIYSLNPREGYWGKTRQFANDFLTKNMGEAPEEEDIRVVVPAREQRILYPEELSDGEVKRWQDKLRNSHDVVLTVLPQQKNREALEAATRVHVRSLISHYGDTEAIIGLDPGSGGYELAKMIAEEIYQQTLGKYTVVFLRPENPQALLLDMEERIRSNPEEVGKNIVYLSIRFSDSLHEPEVHWPGRKDVTGEKHRNSSQELAKILHQQLLEAMQERKFS